jgi:hypothetical protein
VTLGVLLGEELGRDDGINDGAAECILLGSTDGDALGTLLGIIDGSRVGALLGDVEGDIQVGNIKLYTKAVGSELIAYISKSVTDGSSFIVINPVQLSLLAFPLNFAKFPDAWSKELKVKDSLNTALAQLGLKVSIDNVPPSKSSIL